MKHQERREKCFWTKVFSTPTIFSCSLCFYAIAENFEIENQIPDYASFFIFPTFASQSPNQYPCQNFSYLFSHQTFLNSHFNKLSIICRDEKTPGWYRYSWFWDKNFIPFSLSVESKVFQEPFPTSFIDEAALIFIWKWGLPYFFCFPILFLSLAISWMRVFRNFAKL